MDFETHAFPAVPTGQFPHATLLLLLKFALAMQVSNYFNLNLIKISLEGPQATKMS